MKEYNLSAFVLGRAQHKEHDTEVHLYTKELGRVRALAKGLRKITSKLSGHLQPLSFVKVRLIEKNAFHIVDAKEIFALPPSLQAISLAEFIKAGTAELEPDMRFWYDIVRAGDSLRVKGSFSYLPLIRDLGFDPAFAACEVCGNKQIKYFSLKDLAFLCALCLEQPRTLKHPINRLELIDIYVS